MQIFQGVMTEAGTNEYTVERLNRSNLPDLVKLHAAVYGELKTGYFTGKYDTSYTGISYIGFLAYNNNRVPIAFYGVTPCFLTYGNEEILAAQSVDTMTHPEHRYKGMFVELSHKTFELCKESGIRVIFGFPNQNSLHGAIHKLGWKMTGFMDYFNIPVKTIPLYSLSRRFQSFKKLYAWYTRLILSKFLLPEKGLSNSMKEEGFAVVNRTTEYLQYRTYSATRLIRAGKCKAWIKLSDSLMIGDIEGANKHNFPELLKELKRIAALLGIRQVQFHCSRETGLHHLFSQSITPVPSFHMLFQDFGSPIPIEKVKFTLADIDIF
jgi:hypothetical protein